jgi:hypothetical protein
MFCQEQYLANVRSCIERDEALADRLAAAGGAAVADMQRLRK